MVSPPCFPEHADPGIYRHGSRIYEGETFAYGGGYTYHGWVTVKENGAWYVYDVELQKHSGVSAKYCYKVPASSSYYHFHDHAFNLY